jgi:branched-chain amino acid transport system ATP-binding protein
MSLTLRSVQASYGSAQVLFDVSLRVDAGEVVTLVGRNGMGKTTTVHSIMGICQPTGGEIHFRGESIMGQPSHVIARRGIGLVAEGRRIFPNLTVKENLLVGARPGASSTDWTFDKVVALFPRLKERLANSGAQLSGGEQQMLAIGRALLTNPMLLILDEATEGLAPIVREEIWSTLKLLKQSGVSMIVIDKDLAALCEIASRHYVIEKGAIAWQGSSAELIGDGAVQRRFLSVGDEDTATAE